MKKLKTISLYSILIFSLFLITLLYVLISLGKPIKSNYEGYENVVIGTIYDCDIKEDKTVIKIKAKENILINYYDNYKCDLGTKIKAYGEMSKPNSNTNFYLFNYKNYLLSLKINYTFKATKIINLGVNTNLIYKIKNDLYGHVVSYKTKSYLEALILGKTSNIEEDIKESYQVNGISHLLAISGAQIAILSTIIMFLLNKILNKNISHLITCILLIFYLFITNFEPSILRSVIFFILLTINKIFQLKLDTLSILIMTASFLLMINPYFIYSLGFLLSFTVSFYLILFKKIIFQNENYFIKTLNISLIAFLSSAPIIINSFFTLNLLSLFINLYFSALMSIIYPISLLTFIYKPLDKVLLFLINIMENASLKFSALSIFNISLCHLNLIFVIVYYIVITTILYFYSKGKNYIYIFFMILIIHHNINYLNIIPTLTMIDVGQGDSVLLKLKNNNNILIDTGGIVRWDNKTPYNLSKNVLIPYLKAEGVTKIDYLILTHGDYDHAGESLNLIKDFKVKHIILNKENNSLENKIVKNFNGKVTNMTVGTLKIGNITLNFLNDLNSHNENDDSLIIYTKIKNRNILLMGDASEKTEKYLLGTYSLPNVDILKVGHHGSKTSSSKEFISKIKPKISLISAGKNNMYGHPHKKTLRTLEKSKILITQKDGAIKINLENGDIFTVR